MSAAIAVAVAVVTALGALATAPPAEAAVLQTGDWITKPVTWVDDEGRQLTVALIPRDDGDSIPTPVLVVARDLPDGTPDPAWGTDGVRDLTITPPAGLVVREPILAASADGLITTTWRGFGCAETSACDRWFVRTDATGTTVGTPVKVVSDDRPVRGLADGSFVTVDGGGAPGWWGPDGVDRGYPDLGGATGQAVVDRSGRLLVATSAEHVVRKPAGGPTDLDLDLSASCGAGAELLRVGASAADDGFATVCTRDDNGLTVDRRDGDGAVAWSTTVTLDDPAGAVRSPTAILVDDQERVWVGGYGELVPLVQTEGVAVVQAFTEDGAEPVAYHRRSPHFSTYETGSGFITELRPGDGDRVAMADHFGCCLHSPGWTYPQSVVTTRQLPEPPAAPTCTPSAVSLSATTKDSATVHFDRCPFQEAPVRPTGYRIELRRPDGTLVADAALPAGGAASFSEHTFTGLAWGRTLVLTVRASNEVGDGPASAPVAVVPPFRYLDEFVGDLYTFLRGTAPPADWSDLRASFVSGSVAPEDLAADLLDEGLASDHVEPVARLYRAVFLRDPDRGGLQYWTSRHRAGRSLQSIADEFARSSEFQRRYGSLTDRQFVARLYQNVFGRPADPDGLDFWARRLTSGRATRGGVVRQFSESSEGRRRMRPIVEPLATSLLLLNRLPTAAERAAWAAFAEPHREVARAIVRSEEWATRATA